MAVKAKTVKRVTKVLELNNRGPKPYEFYGRYEGDEPFKEMSCLKTKLDIYLPDFERLGRPKKVRVTITVVED